MNAEPLVSASEGSMEEEHTALSDALDRLGDEQRGLIVEHYFQKASLDQIAQRAQLSKRAIWNRMDRARQSLKEALATLGMATLVPDPTLLLEACQPVSLSTNLVPGVMAKLAAPPIAMTHVVPSELCKGRLTSVTPSLALGGIVMTVKQATWTTVTMTVVILLGVGIVGGLMIRARGKSQNGAAVGHGQLAQGTTNGQSHHPKEASTAISSSKGTRAMPDRPSGLSPLRLRLEEYCRRLDREFPDRTARIAKGKEREYNHDFKAYIDRLSQWMAEELEGAKEQICSDPVSFLAFFHSVASEPYLEGLLFTLFSPNGSGDRHNEADVPRNAIESQDYTKLPKQLTDGLLESLRSGSSAQKLELLKTAPLLVNQSAEFVEACRSLISDVDPKVQLAAMSGFPDNIPLSESQAVLLRHMANNWSAPDLASSAVRVLATTRAPGFEDLLFGIIGSPSNPARTIAFNRLTEEYRQNRASDLTFEQRLLDSVSQAFATWTDPDPIVFERWIRVLVLHIPHAKALPAFDAAASHAPTPELASCVRAIATAIRSGSADMQKLFALLP